MSDYLVIGEDGQQKGPYTFTQVQNMWDQGSLNGHLFYWTEGMSDWHPLSEIADRLETKTVSPITPHLSPTKQVVIQTNIKQGALIGGIVCFVLGLVFMCVSLLFFFIYGPLLLVAFILSIVAMAQGRVAGGVTLLISTLIVPPLVWIMMFMVGLGVVTNAIKNAAKNAEKARQAEMATNSETTNQPTKP